MALPAQIYATDGTNVTQRTGSAWASHSAAPANTRGISLARDGSGALFVISQSNLYEWSGTAWTNLGAVPWTTPSGGIHARTKDEVWFIQGPPRVAKWVRGVGFTEYYTDFNASFQPKSIFAASASLISVAGTISGNMQIYRTTDGGANWSSVFSVGGGAGAGIFSPDGVNWYAGGSNALYESINSGASWASLGAYGSTGAVRAVWGTGPNEMWLASAGSGSDVIIARWNGSAYDNTQTWNDVGFNGVGGICGLNASAIYWTKEATGNAVKWNGSAFSQEGIGGLTNVSYSPNMMTAETLASDGRIQQEQIDSPLTTKGDLFTHDTDDQRLGVGADGQVLTADSAEATGIKWATAPGGGGSDPRYDDDTVTGTPSPAVYTVTVPTAMRANANVPGGFDLRWLALNGITQKIVTTSPGERECRVTSSTAIEVGNAVNGDEIEYSFGAA